MDTTHLTARGLQDMLVIQGQYDTPMALAIAREIFFEAPRRLMGMEP